MSESNTSHRWLAVALLLAIFAAAAVWGRAGYRAIRYHHYEEIVLPNGAGKVTFIQYRDPHSSTIASHIDPTTGDLSGSAGQIPLNFQFESGGETFTFVFPGAELAQKSGEIAFVRTAGRPADEEVLKMIEERRKKYPDLDWSKVEPLPSPPDPSSFGVGGNR